MDKGEFSEETGTTDAYTEWVNGYDPDSDKPPQIPEGDYRAKCVGFGFDRMFGRQKKVNLRFRIIEPPRMMGCELKRYYNCPWTGGKRKRRTISPGWFSELMREFSLCFGPPKQRNHVSLDKFKGNLFLIRVSTVKRDYRSREKVAGLEYSVVSEILALATL